MNIFLDDHRWPVEASNWVDFDYTATNWVVVRNYDQFVELIDTQEFGIISFDHDLDRSSTFECIRSSTNQEPFDYKNCKEKTGYHCALYLKEWCKKNNKKIPKYLVHSLNHQGRDNIIATLGDETLIGTHNVDLIFEKADEILKRGKSWRTKQ